MTAFQANTVFESLLSEVASMRETKAVNELKPCPFCGNEFPKEDVFDVDASTPVYSVSCRQCGAGSGLYGGKKACKNAWNSRVA